MSSQGLGREDSGQPLVGGGPSFSPKYQGLPTFLTLGLECSGSILLALGKYLQGLCLECWLTLTVQSGTDKATILTTQSKDYSYLVHHGLDVIKMKICPISK